MQGDIQPGSPADCNATPTAVDMCGGHTHAALQLVFTMHSTSRGQMQKGGCSCINILSVPVNMWYERREEHIHCSACARVHHLCQHHGTSITAMPGTNRANMQASTR
jgi:hypothetical protein